MARALLLIDIQNGFCTGGNLPVPGGDKVVPVANDLMARGAYDHVVASQDWHPANHGSFASQHPGKQPFELGELSGKPQMMWPDHCVQGTIDAEFHPDLNLDGIDYVQRKGQNVNVDSYSAFRDNDRAALTGLARSPRGRGHHRTRPLRPCHRLLCEIHRLGRRRNAPGREGPLHRGCQPWHRSSRRRRRDCRNEGKGRGNCPERRYPPIVLAVLLISSIAFFARRG